MQNQDEVVSEPVKMALDLYGSIVPVQLKEPPPLRVLVPSYEPTTAGYYRVVCPLLECQRQGYLRVLFREDIEKGCSEFEKDERFELSIDWATHILRQRTGSMEVSDTLLDLKNFGKFIVTDQDDYPEAALDTGNKTLIKNWTAEMMDINQRVIREANLLTVTVPFLKEKYSEIRNGPVEVLPNYIDALNKRWNFRKSRIPNKIVFGWMAGAVHQTESEIAFEIVKRVLESTTNTIFKMIGFYDSWIEDLPRERVIIDPLLKATHEYPQRMNNVDIGIAPLASFDFNNGKSDLKYLEYTMAGALPIVQKFGPYLHLPRSTTVHCDSVDDWVSTLCFFAKNPASIRKEYVKALKYVIHQRTVYTNAKRWAKAYSVIM
jgi:hypothetical protein